MAELEARRHWVLASAAIAKGYVVLGRESYSLGRGQECMIPLNSTSVSRKHCEVSWGKPSAGYWITDLGSTNGTTVNGQVLKAPRRLEHDDVISLGQVTIRFLMVEATREELARRFDPRTEETNKILTTGPLALLSGRITRTVLHEVCQLIEMNRRTGELHARCQGQHGVVRFKEGVIVDAKCGSEKGENAARMVLDFRNGEYSFGPASKPPEGPLKLKALAIIMELARETDELEKTRSMPMPKLRRSSEGPDEDTTDHLGIRR